MSFLSCHLDGFMMLRRVILMYSRVGPMYSRVGPMYSRVGPTLSLVGPIQATTTSSMVIKREDRKSFLLMTAQAMEYLHENWVLHRDMKSVSWRHLICAIRRPVPSALRHPSLRAFCVAPSFAPCLLRSAGERLLVTSFHSLLGGVTPFLPRRAETYLCDVKHGVEPLFVCLFVCLFV
jgi:hypothetical protein